jgi:hypothetical protein
MDLDITIPANAMFYTVILAMVLLDFLVYWRCSRKNDDDTFNYIKLDEVLVLDQHGWKRCVVAQEEVESIHYLVDVKLAEVAYTNKKVFLYTDVRELSYTEQPDVAEPEKST